MFCMCNPVVPPYSENDIVLMSKMVYGEARGLPAEEQALCVWVVLQRTEAEGKWYPTIEENIRVKSWFVGFDDKHPVLPDIYSICESEMYKWWRGEPPPILPPYCNSVPFYFFNGGGDGHNYFRREW